MIDTITQLRYSSKATTNHKDDYSAVSVAAEEAHSNKRACWNKLACKSDCF